MKLPKVLLSASNIKSVKDDRLLEELNKVILYLSQKKFASHIAPILSHERAKLAFPFFWSRFEDIARSSYFEVNSFERIMQFYTVLIEHKRSDIISYTEKRKKFESNLLAGNLLACNAVLDDVYERWGESIWWARSKLQVLLYKKNGEETQKFLDDLQKRANDGFVSYYIKAIVTCIHATSPAADLKIKIQKALEEFDRAGIDEVSWFVHALCFPAVLSTREDRLDKFYMLQQFPFIDIYNFINQVLAKNIFEPMHHGEQKVFKNYFEKLNDILRVSSESVAGCRRLQSATIERDLHKHYSLGQYRQVLDGFSLRIQLIERPILLANLIAKAAIREGTYLGCGWSLVDDTIKNLIEIHSLTSRASQARQELVERIIRLNGTDIVLDLQAELVLAAPQFFEPDLSRKLLQITSFSRPIYREGEHNNAYDISIIKSGSSFSIPTINEDDTTSSSRGGSPYDIPKDYIERRAAVMFAHGSMDALLKFSSEHLIIYPESYICYPLNSIINYIEENFIFSLDALVVCHYYVKYINSEKRTLLNELFEEYLYESGHSKPSELFSIMEEETLEVERLFFNDICSFESLDFLDAFQSSDELRAERIKIIEHLYMKGLVSKEAYSDELDQIVRLVVFDSTTSNFSRSKIYVDEKAIVKKIKEEISAYFELYQISKAGEPGEEDGLFVYQETDRQDNTFVSAVLSGQQSSLLVKIIETVHRAFLYDEMFGLDSNLSSEIRHGIFSNFILSEADSKHLIAEKDESGRYKKINYWYDFYSEWLVPSLMAEINKQLIWFSSEFNGLIDESEKWMKIGSNDPELPFDFSITIDDYNFIKSVALDSNSIDQVIGAIFFILWGKTEDGLHLLREKINAELKHKIERLFDELTSRVISVKGNAVLAELMNNIESAKNNTREIIGEIAEWLYRSEERKFDSQRMSQLVDISISCFEKIKGRQFKMNRIYSQYAHDPLIPGSAVNSVILAILNLLTNAVRHSGLDLEVEIFVRTTVSESDYKLLIGNTLAVNKLRELDDDFFENARQAIKDPNSIELLRREGGTGIAKAYHHLKTAHANFSLDVFLDDNVFYSEVTYVNVGVAS